MTVEQLIERLRAFPPETEVWRDGDQGPHPVNEKYIAVAGALYRCSCGCGEVTERPFRPTDEKLKPVVFL